MKRKYTGAQRIAPIREEFARMREALAGVQPESEEWWDIVYPDDRYMNYERSTIMELIDRAKTNGFVRLAEEISEFAKKHGLIDPVPRVLRFVHSHGRKVGEMQLYKVPNRRGDRVDHLYPRAQLTEKHNGWMRELLRGPDPCQPSRLSRHP